MNPRQIFDYIHVREINCKNGYNYTNIVQQRSQDQMPRAFIEDCDIIYGGAGTANGRVWIPYKGNLHGVIGFPFHMFRDQTAIELFSIVASYGIKDVCNKFAPGEYCSKFPNDVICKKHHRKTGGIICRKEGKFCLVIFALNLVKAPPDALLRKQGIRACCLRHHTKNVPSSSEFLYATGMEILNLYNRLNSVYSIVNYMNESLSECGEKLFRAEINNPNADILVDGALWTRKFPNALTKGYLNGEEYENQETYFDTEYFNPDGDPTNSEDNNRSSDEEEDDI